MKDRFLTDKLCLVALGMVINTVCPFIAMNLHLPIYMDSIGTILITRLLGAKYGMIAGISGSVISGLTFDIYSLYYFPVQILTSLTTEYVSKKGWLKGKKLIGSGLIISFPTAVASAVITAFIFGGITSSGSSYLVALFHGIGMNLTVSCFIVQVITEYADKSLAAFFSEQVMKKGILGEKYGKIQ